MVKVRELRIETCHWTFKDRMEICGNETKMLCKKNGHISKESVRNTERFMWSKTIGGLIRKGSNGRMRK